MSEANIIRIPGGVDIKTFDMAGDYFKRGLILVEQPLRRSDPEGRWHIRVVEQGKEIDPGTGKLTIRKVFNLSGAVFDNQRDASAFINSAIKDAFERRWFARR